MSDTPRTDAQSKEISGHAIIQEWPVVAGVQEVVSAHFCRHLERELTEANAILKNPDTWMRWCDNKVLEKAEAVEAELDTLQRSILDGSHPNLVLERKRIADLRNAAPALLAAARREERLAQALEAIRVDTVVNHQSVEYYKRIILVWKEWAHAALAEDIAKELAP